MFGQLRNNFFLKGDFLGFFHYFIPHCFIHRPSDSTVSEDAGIEPMTVATLALDVRRSNHSGRSKLHNSWELGIGPTVLLSHQESTLFMTLRPNLQSFKEPRNRFRHAGNRFLGSQGLQIRYLVSLWY